MAIWGSLIGGMIGFSLGGPFGMLLGSLIGGKISRAKARSSGFGSFAQPQQVFALSLIVLSAKLRKADGQVSREELIAVKDKLKIPENELDQVGKIFNQAKQESKGYEPYAKQIAQIYKGNINILEEVINILFYIAEADGNVSDSELRMKCIWIIDNPKKWMDQKTNVTMRTSIIAFIIILILSIMVISFVLVIIK